MDDRTCLSYWFPRIAAAGLPVPRTIIVRMDAMAQEDLWRPFDGKPLTEASEAFFAELRGAADAIGYPCFLRTGYTSGKHQWAETCYLAEPELLARHVLALAEFSECAGIIGLPWDVWAVRELLPVRPVATCPRWQGMPVIREYRAFVRDGAVQCVHPYWPAAALKQGGVADQQTAFRLLTAEAMPPAAEELAALAGAVLGGYWSVDLLETERGWYVTDLAAGERSFHWAGCPLAEGGDQ